MVILRGSDRRIYGKMVEDSKDAFTKGNKNQPENTMEAYKLLVNYKDTQNNLTTRMVDESEEVYLVNVGGIKGKSNS